MATMGVLLGLSDNARRLYEAGFVHFADEHGVCKANQRQLIQQTGMAFKTLIKARDELVSAKLVVRFEYKYQGKRDWYQLRPFDDVQREKRAAERARRDRETQQAHNLALELPGIA